METLCAPCKVWSLGKESLIITVPANVKNILGISQGDFLEVTFKKLTISHVQPVTDHTSTSNMVSSKGSLRVRNN